ncbi:hypothetical protein J6590_026706 [Homalodisca vitripennis]|nr:hypothetical protein J6590_026706 [Homalodisca vitripennis]
MGPVRSLEERPRFDRTQLIVNLEISLRRCRYTTSRLLHTILERTNMADEYPDPDEEFELMHAEEMEMLNEMDNMDYGERRDKISVSLQLRFKAFQNKNCHLPKEQPQESDNLPNPIEITATSTPEAPAIEPPTPMRRLPITATS